MRVRKEAAEFGKRDSGNAKDCEVFEEIMLRVYFKYLIGQNS